MGNSASGSLSLFLRSLLFVFASSLIFRMRVKRSLKSLKDPGLLSATMYHIWIFCIICLLHFQASLLRFVQTQFVTIIQKMCDLIWCTPVWPYGIFHLWVCFSDSWFVSLFFWLKRSVAKLPLVGIIRLANLFYTSWNLHSVSKSLFHWINVIFLPQAYL